MQLKTLFIKSSSELYPNILAEIFPQELSSNQHFQ